MGTVRTREQIEALLAASGGRLTKADGETVSGTLVDFVPITPDEAALHSDLVEANLDRFRVVGVPQG